MNKFRILFNSIKEKKFNHIKLLNTSDIEALKIFMIKNIF